MLHIFLRYIEIKKIKLNFIFINNDKNLTTDDLILVIDDCSYSGSQLYDCLNKNIIKKNMNIYVLFPFISEKAIEAILSLRHNFNFPDSRFVMNTLLDIMDEKKIENIFNFYYYNNKNIKFFIENYPIYFDHKLPDIISSFPYIYSGLVINKQNIDNLKKLNIDNIIIIPVIQGCNQIITNYYDLMSINCPIPPYSRYNDKKLFMSDASDVLEELEKKTFYIF